MSAWADRLGPPRMLHPAAWWGWGIALCAMATRTTNPIYLGALLAVVGVVVAQRQEMGTALSLGFFLALAVAAVVVRVVTAIVLGSGVSGTTVIFDLPQVALPTWLAGVRLGGEVTLEVVLSAVYTGMQLATVVICLGACTVLANPRRLLRYLPTTLYDVGTAAVVSLTVLPQLAREAGEVRAARRLRGHHGAGLRDLRAMMMPVLEGALERSMTLAASMESRGYGSRRSAAGTPRLATALTLVGVGGVTVGLFGLLGVGPDGLGLPSLVLGCALAAAALLTGVRRDRRRPYRPDPWKVPEWCVLLSAWVPLVLLSVRARSGDTTVQPAVSPATVPAVNPAVLLGLLLPAVAAVVAPRTPLRAVVEDRLAEQARAARPPGESR